MPGIVWWEVEVSDPDAFFAFHGALNGWRFERAFTDTDLGADYWIVQNADGAGLGGLQRSAPQASPPGVGTRVYTEVDDLEATLDRVVALGGKVERGRTVLGADDRWFATYADSTGVWTATP